MEALPKEIRNLLLYARRSNRAINEVRFEATSIDGVTAVTFYNKLGEKEHRYEPLDRNIRGAAVDKAKDDKGFPCSYRFIQPFPTTD